MTEPLRVDPAGLLNYAQQHADVSSGMSGLLGAGAPDGKGVDTSHGVVSSAVSTALSSALEGRGEVFGAVTETADKFSERLQRASRAYADGDRQAGERIKAAAGGMDGNGSGSQTGGPTDGAPSAQAGQQMIGQMGQMLGQVGQQVGQLAQSVTQPLQGLAQGLQQIPQQIAQAAQQASQSTSAGGAGQGKDLKVRDAERGAREGDDAERKKSARAERDGTGRPQTSHDQAVQGNSSGAGRAPIDPSAPAARPTATRAPVD
ncbi:type VII secretion target [Mycolicibacterium sp. lyk4-40-TYG-92]|uniref:type VII secretion target n=1 Tax=Mycolicibacterium sp. lyk4-40-TYG-92 TaxID=3040295 RepID=UPI002550A3FD|nr:type VII secretion target [Mycolicibacterium sp. lyk4-40-TYG-92]